MYRWLRYNLYHAAFASDRLGAGQRAIVDAPTGPPLRCRMHFMVVAGAAAIAGSVLAMTAPHSSLVRYLVHLIFRLPSHAQDADNRLDGSGDGRIRGKFGTLQGRFVRGRNRPGYFYHCAACVRHVRALAYSVGHPEGQKARRILARICGALRLCGSIFICICLRSRRSWSASVVWSGSGDNGHLWALPR